MTKTQRILEDVAALYRLVEDMRVLVGRLREVDVDVRMRTTTTKDDPLCTFAALTITMKPGCEAS